MHLNDSGSLRLFSSQEQELMGRITELQDEVSRRKNHVTQLDHQIHTLNENISTLTKELELKGKEVLKIRSEANQQIRYDRAWAEFFSGAGTAYSGDA